MFVKKNVIYANRGCIYLIKSKLILLNIITILKNNFIFVYVLTFY